MTDPTTNLPVVNVTGHNTSDIPHKKKNNNNNKMLLMPTSKIARVLALVVVVVAVVLVSVVLVAAGEKANGTTTTEGPMPKQCTCQVRLTSILKESQFDQARSGMHQFDCVHAVPTTNEATPATTTTNRTKTTAVRLDVAMEDDVYLRNEAAFHADKWFLRFPCEWIVDDALPREKNDHVETLSWKQVQGLTVSPTNDGRHLRAAKDKAVEPLAPQPPRSRRRLSNVGKQYYGIVIVHAAGKTNPLSTADAEDMVDGANQQFQECSGAVMELVKQDNTVSITLPNSIGQYSSLTVDDEMNKMICRHYGYGDGCEISKERDLDHVIFSLPFGLSDDKPGVFWAKASAGDSRRYSVYSGGSYNFEGYTFDGGFFVPSTIMHELGHNYRLGHAMDPRNNGYSGYGDKTTHMGGGADTRKCFNGYNYFVLGWHQSQTNEVSLSSNVARTYNLKGIDDLSTGGIVNIKVDKYYVTFNLKSGINDESGEYGDEVVIHEGKNIRFGQTNSAAYYDTSVVANLAGPRDKFETTVGNGKLRIELCTIDTQGSGGAMVSIGLDATNCGVGGPVTNPSGMQSLTSGVPVTGLQGAKNDLLEYVMEFSYTPDSVTCSTSGGTGDVDLLVNSMSSPQALFSSDVNSCYSRGTSTSQSCTAANLKGRFVYVTVEGDDPFSGVSLTCTATGEGSVQTVNESEVNVSGGDNDDDDDDDDTTADASSVLRSGVPQTDIGLARGGTVLFTMPMPSDAKSISCSISGGIGDADLYTRFDETVDVTRRTGNQCVPWLTGNDETCGAELLRPLGSVLHVGVHAYDDFEGVSLECDIVREECRFC